MQSKPLAIGKGQFLKVGVILVFSEAFTTVRMGLPVERRVRRHDITFLHLYAMAELLSIVLPPSTRGIGDTHAKRKLP
jgi:hypothetical protein